MNGKTETTFPSPPSACVFDRETYTRSLEMLAPDYDCPVCHGANIYLPDNSSVARYCACRPVRSALARLRRQGLDHAARACTLDSFVASEPWQQQMLSAALAFVSQEKPGWLYLGGQSGCGKTHLGTAAAVALTLRGQELRYMPWTRDVMRLKSLSMDERRSDTMDALCAVPVLYIDDLFKAAPTDADKHIAFEILSARYARDDRPTIISSERTLSELFDVDEALAGRIAERCGKDGVLQIPKDRRKNYRLAGLL